MKNTILLLGLSAIVALSAIAAEMNDSNNASAKETAFIKEAADGGMAEVELGRLAEKTGQRDEVKKFGQQMVTDHGKANDDLKAIASKLGVTVPDRISAEHQSTVDSLSKKSAHAFDSAYVAEMISDPEKDIAEFEKAQGETTNSDLKQFIDKTIPVMKHHLEMAKGMKETK